MIDFKAYKKNIEILFAKNNIDSEEVDILFCEFFDCSRSELLLKKEITKQEKTKIDRVIKKRLKGCPIQKIFKKAYFFDYTLFVNNNVLCPRPETELLTEECINYINNIIQNKNIVNKKLKVLDLCTGSGCIAITIKNKTKTNVYASDISLKAIHVAKKNAKKLNSKVTFIKSNMFNNIKQKFDIIISNPPYIPTLDVQQLDIEVKKYDPTLALDGGYDGLKFYKIIASQAKSFLNSNGKIFLEVGIFEAEKVKYLLEQNGFDCYVKKDYNNIDRIVVGELIW